MEKRLKQHLLAYILYTVLATVFIMKHLGDRIVLPRMALNMAGIYVNDKQVDLMLRILEKLENRKWLMNIKDVCKVEREHLEEWAEYEQAERERQSNGY